MSRFLLTLLTGILIGAVGMWYLLEGPPGQHDAIGHWRGGLFDVRIEAGGGGSVNTLALTWDEVDDATVKLNYTEKGDDMVVLFVLEDQDSGTLKIPVFPMKLKRVVAD